MSWLRLFAGRHEQVMSPRTLEQARRDGDYPDVYIRSGELEIDVDDANVSALMDVSTDLPEAERQQIEAEEGLLASHP